MDFIAVNNFGDTREGGLAGPMGAFIITLLAIATVLLIRNMNKRLRRLPDSFDNVDASKRASGTADRSSPAGSDGTPPERDLVDGDRSDSTTVETEPQVSDVDPDDRPAASDGGATKS